MHILEGDAGFFSLTLAANGTRDLPLEDQLAVIVAGREAAHIFDAPVHPSTYHDDLDKQFQLLKVRPKREHGPLIHEGHARAHQRLILHRLKVAANLERLLAGTPKGIFVNPFERGEIGSDLFRAACEMGLEGLVSKHRNRPYQSGRSKHWIKVKNRRHPAMERVMEAFT